MATENEINEITKAAKESLDKAVPLKDSEADNTGNQSDDDAGLNALIKEHPELSFLAMGGKMPIKTEQERLKKRLRVTRIISLLLAVITIITLSLFLYEKDLFERKCAEQYTQTLSKIDVIMLQCVSSDFDYDTNYRELTASLNAAQIFVSYTDEKKENKECINQVYFAAVKLPNQLRERMSEVEQGVALILDGRGDEGYAVLQTFVDDMDRLDYGTEQKTE